MQAKAESNVAAAPVHFVTVCERRLGLPVVSGGNAVHAGPSAWLRADLGARNHDVICFEATSVTDVRS